ncbi:MAG: ABC transporter [Gammaproteobacteria bacterium]|nr:ABC transporter [Gammaproteobacteria bacterium]
MNKKILTGSSLLIAVILFLAVNIFSGAALKSVRMDLTENSLYTLSQGSKNILEKLEEPVTLRFYLSQKLATSLPGINSYTVRVQELLEEYKRAAGDNLELLVLDPEPFSEEEDRAVSFGLQGIPVDEGNTSFYFGLAGTNSTDDEKVIEFFQPNREEFLENDITKLIYQLASPKQKIVGIMSTLPIQGDTGRLSFLQRSSAAKPWMVVEQIRQLSEVRPLETDIEEIPEDIDILMLVHPKGLSDTVLYAIDQFVLKGGRAIVFADPYSEAEKPVENPQNPLAALQAPRNSEFSKLFDAWGVELTPGKTVGDLRIAKKVQMRRGQRTMVVNYPVWMDLDESHYNKEDIITAKLEGIVVATAGSLVKKGDTATELVPLLQSSEQAMQIDVSKLGFMGDPESLARDFKPEGKKFTLAARITGKVKTAFPDGKPESEKEEPEEDKSEKEQSEQDKENKKHLAESAEPVNIIVVADSDLLEDKFWVRVQNFMGQRIAIPQAANASFVTNALDNLGGSNDLISVRNRGNFTRAFTRVEELRQEAEQRFREKEKKLQTRLQETEKEIRDLQNKKPKSNVLTLSAQQQQEISSFRKEKAKIRKELRTVQHQLRKDIDALESKMKFINIGLIPLLIVLGAAAMVFYRRQRRQASKSQASIS